jgi:DNA primase
MDGYVNRSHSSADGKSQVLAAVDIVQLIGQTVALKRQGRDFIGLCPFHQEKSPSFHVSPGRQFYYCFGCKKHGNAIDFVMERDRIEFKDALTQLANQAGIDLPQFGGKKEDKSERQMLLEAQSAACVFFERQLADPNLGKTARDYLHERGFTDESIKRFRLGMAPPAWDGLLSGPVGRKFTARQLALAGLAKPNSRGDGYYDTFRNRLIFPIRDDLGRIIAFGGRVLPGGDDPAKYLNSPETPLFSKSRCIFGLDLAKNRIVETRTVAVVEGYADVVMAHQYGLSNVVSVLGTALTEQHVGMLKRFADRIVLLFDPDAAGASAADRAIELLLRQPVEIHVATLPDGMDPDEFLLKYGTEAFERVLKEAPDALSYQWTLLCRRFGQEDGLTGQQKAIEAYLNQLAEVRGSGPIDPIRWGGVLARISRMLEMPVDTLQRRFKFRKTSRGKALMPVAQNDGAMEAVSAPSTPSRPLMARDRAERTILGILLIEPGRWFDLQRHVRVEDFTDADRTRLARLYWEHQRDEGEPLFREFLGALTAANLGALGIELVEEAEGIADRDSELNDAVSHLAEAKIRREEEKHLAALRRTKEENVSEEEEIARLRAFVKNNQPGLHRLGPMRSAGV